MNFLYFKRLFVVFILFNSFPTFVCGQTCGQFLNQSNTSSNSATFGSVQWQSFSANSNGRLTQIDLFKNGCENFAFTLKIYAGTGNAGTVLYTNNYSFNICSQVFTLNIPFASAPILSATAPYTFELNMTSSSSGSPIQLGSSNANPFSGGYYYSSSYGTQNTWDLYFSTYITANPNPIPSIVSQSNCSCSGLPNGSINTQVVGGTPPFSYSWSPGGFTTANISNIGPGNYTLNVTDAVGCTGTVSATITQPPALLSSFSGNTPVSCNGGNNGSVSVNATGGIPGYTYSWSPPPGAGQNTSNASGMTAGNYTAVVTDLNGCTSTNTVSIFQPSPLTVGVFNITNVSCNGAANGSISVAPGGGNGGYSYSWIPSPGSGQGTATASGLSPGNYTVVLTDSKSCTANTSGTIIQPSALSGFFSSITNVTCTGLANGSATAQGTGGTPPFTYSWSPSPGSGQGTATASNLVAGNYTVSITDANSCVYSMSTLVNQPAGSLVAVITGYINVSCFGTSTGSSTVTVSGGTTPYNYVWSPSPGTGQGTANAGSMTAGAYTVTATDANNCVSTTTLTINEPAQLSTNIIKNDVSCFGTTTGATTVIVSGGNGGYTFNWSPTPGTGQGTNVVGGMSAGIYTVITGDANGCSTSDTVFITQPLNLTSVIDTFSNVTCNGYNNGTANLSISGGVSPYAISWNPVPGSGQSTGFVSLLSPGTYTANVTDNNGCLSNDTVTITQPANLSSSATITNISCNGLSDGAIFLSTADGTPPYVYTWSPSPTTGQGTANVSGLAAGNYTVNIDDSNLCNSAYSITVNEPLAISASITVTDVSCSGFTNGAIDLTASGGVFPYSFSWSNGAITEDISGITSAVYTVTITDGNTCTSSTTAFVGSANAITYSFVKTSPTCFGYGDGIVDLNITGGTIPYNFNWSNGNTSEDLISVGAGNYTVTVTDANNCQITDTVILSQPNYIVNGITVTNATCFAGTNGAMNLFVSGATPPFTFSWSNGDTTQNISNLAAGTYTVMITDANNCTAMNIDSVQQPSFPLGSSLSIVNNPCFGDSLGALYSSTSGGTLPYSYLWDNGSTTQDLLNIPAGSYTLTVVDAQNCTASISTTVTEPASSVNGFFNTTGIECFGASTGSIDLLVSGGVAPYVYSWNSGQVTEDLANIVSGSYVVDVVDSNGCMWTDSTFVSQPASPTLASVSVFASDTIICSGNTIQFIASPVNGGLTPTYQWLLNGNQISGAVTDTFNANFLTNGDQISVVLNSSDLCLLGTSVNSNSTTITVNSITSIISENLNTQSFCQNATSIPIDILSSGSGLNYQWFVNSTPAYSGATLLTGETNSILNPSTTTVGTFYYFCVATGLCGSDTSSVSGLQQIQGNLPGTASINSNLNTVCAGDTVFFNSTLTNFGSNPTLQWQLNGINISGANSNTFSIASLANNDSVSLTVISSTTVCPANTVYYSNSIPIVVNPLPSLTVNPNVNFCEGDTLFLTASGIGNIGWTGPNGFISSVTNPYILNGSALNTGTYLVSLELNGCIKKDSVNLQVINTPSIGITGVGNLTCIASSINLNATTNATNPTYLWTGVGIVSGVNSNLINLNLPGTYFLTVKDQVTGCSNTDSVSIMQTSSLPDISVDTTQFLTCTQAFSSIGGFSSVPGIIYSWSPGGSNPNASSTIVNVPGNYTLTVTDPSNGCVNSAVVPVISTASNPNIFVGPNSAITCSQLNTFLIGGSLDTNVILLWSNNIGIPTSDTILISVPGVYTLTVSDTITGCISTASVTILDETAGCDEISFFNGLTPNNDGSNDVFQLRNIENYPENTFTLFNRYGMKVWDGKNYDNTKTAFRGLDNKGTELISGTYFFVLEYNNVELKGWIELIR